MTLDLRLINRLIRFMLLRGILDICLVLFTLEKKIHPPVPKKEKRLLFIIIGGLGDCLLSDFMFRCIKEKWPDAQVDVFSGCFEEMWERIESIDHLFLFMRHTFKTPWAYVRLFRTIYRNEYDIAVEGLAMLPPRGIYPLIPFLVLEASQAPIRIGRASTGSLSLLRPREMGFMGRKETEKRMNTQANRPEENPFLTHTVHILPPDQRQEHEYETILRPLGLQCRRGKESPRIQPDPALNQWAEVLLRSQWASHEDVIIGFTTETTRKIKAWPTQYYLKVIERGLADHMKFVMLGLEQQPTDSPFHTFPRESFLDLSGKTGLGEMIAIIKHCSLFFSCDVGPSHIAQACRVPTLVLFGPSNEKEFGPVDLDLHRLIVPKQELTCRPCVLGPCIQEKSCIHSISPDEVYDALIKHVEHFPYKSGPSDRLISEKLPKVLCAI